MERRKDLPQVCARTLSTKGGFCLSTEEGAGKELAGLPHVCNFLGCRYDAMLAQCPPMVPQKNSPFGLLGESEQAGKASEARQGQARRTVESPPEERKEGGKEARVSGPSWPASLPACLHLRQANLT